MNPKLAEIHHLYSFYFLTLGRFDDAVTVGRRALESDPLSLIYGRSLGMCLYFARRYDEAVAQYHETLELDPSNVSLHELLGNAYERQRRHGEAIAEWQKTAVLTGEHALAASLGSACAEGDFARAVRDRARRDGGQHGSMVPVVHVEDWRYRLSAGARRNHPRFCCPLETDCPAFTIPGRLFHLHRRVRDPQ